MIGAATGRRIIWPVVDVRRGQVATANYRPVPGGVVQDGPAEVVTPEELAALINANGEDALVVGDHGALPDGVFQGLHRVKVGRPRFPAADVILEIAQMRAGRDVFASEFAFENEIGEISPVMENNSSVYVLQVAELLPEGPATSRSPGPSQLRFRA